MLVMMMMMMFRLIQEEKDSAEQRAEELESQVGGVPMGGDLNAGGQEGMVARWHAHQAYGQMSPPGNDLPAVPSPAMHPRTAVSQQKYLVVSQRCHCHCHNVSVSTVTVTVIVCQSALSLSLS